MQFENASDNFPQEANDRTDVHVFIIQNITNGNSAYFKALACFDLNGSVVRALPIICGVSFANFSEHKSEPYGL